MPAEFSDIAKSLASSGETLRRESSSGLVFGELASDSGAARFLKALGGNPDLSEEIKNLALRYLADKPSLSDVEVGKVPSGKDSYNWLTNRIGVSSSSPDILSHEASHAGRLGKDSLYRDILSASKQGVSLSNMAAIPAILGIRSLVKDEENKNNILKVLAGLSATVALPNIIEETRATAEALGKSDDKIRSAISLGPGLASHFAHDMLAPMAYYLAGTNLG